MIHPTGHLASRSLLFDKREEGREGGLGSGVWEWEQEVVAVSASFKKALSGFNASTAKETTGNYGEKGGREGGREGPEWLSYQHSQGDDRELW